MKRTAALIAYWICWIYGIDGSPIATPQLSHPLIFQTQVAGALIIGDRDDIWGYAQGEWSRFNCRKHEREAGAPPRDVLLEAMENAEGN